jgi:hypothetical protein
MNGEGLGGTFGPGPNLTDLTFDTVFWVCNGWPSGANFDEFYAKSQILFADCFAEHPPVPQPPPPF